MSAVEAVGWSLVHFIWQGAAVALILAVVLELLRRRGASLRYLVSVAALGIMAVLPVVTALTQPDRTQPTEILPAAQSPRVSVATGTPVEAPLATVNRSQEVIGNRTAGSISLTGHRITRALPWIVAAWLAGVVLLSIRLVGGWYRARQLVRVGTGPVSASLDQLARRVMNRLEISQPVRLLESVLMEVPAVVGWLRPVILIPVSAVTGLTPHQLELLLTHELAHVRRHDYLVNLLQSVAEILFFYHPAVWWVSRRIRQERENCCDDLAAALSGDPRTYAHTLLALEQLRAHDLGLAAAATGGDLLQRVRRLLKPEMESELGSRWGAGALTIALILLIAAGLNRGANAASLRTPQPKIQQRNASPDTVIRHPDPAAEFASRVEWGRRQGTARPGGKYWIGYLVQGGTSGPWVYLDRHVPITGEGLTLYGHIRIGQPHGLSFSGVELRRLIGDHAANDIAIFLGYERNGQQDALTRIHVGSFGLPVHFGGWTLVWLGSAGDPESVSLVSGLYQGTESQELRKDVVATVGMHATSSTAVPPLLQWLVSGRPDAIRSEAAEWLAYHDDARVLPALARAIRTDPSTSVQQEAAEALGELPLRGAIDTLIQVARTHTTRSVRQEAVEALGEREEPAAYEALLAIARNDPSRDIRMEAIETLGDLEDGKGTAALIDLAQTHSDVDARREAVETLGETAPEAKTVELLVKIARTDGSRAVRQEAIETLGEMEDVPEADRALRDLIERHPDPDMQKEGVESLANSSNSRTYAALAEIARTHPQVVVRQEAIDGLAQSEDPRAVDLLKTIALKDADPSLQLAAAEALGEAHPHDAAVKALGVIIWEHPVPEIASAAVEALGELDDPGVVPLLQEVVRRHPSLSVQRQAVKTLAQREE